MPINGVGKWYNKSSSFVMPDLWLVSRLLGNAFGHGHWVKRLDMVADIMKEYLDIFRPVPDRDQWWRFDPFYFARTDNDCPLVGFGWSRCSSLNSSIASCTNNDDTYELARVLFLKRSQLYVNTPLLKPWSSHHCFYWANIHGGCFVLSRKNT